LADAADVLSDQLHQKLSSLAAALRRRAPRLEGRFRRAIRGARPALPELDARQDAALQAIAPAAAFRLLAEGRPISEFFEQVEYNGRRLAKMHLPPSAIVVALEKYDRVLCAVLEDLVPEEWANLQWVRDQLLFCVILTLNNAFYQVREAETRVFYELFRVELESKNLDELLRRFLAALAEFCNTAEARLYLLDEAAAQWSIGSHVGPHAPRKSWRAPNSRKMHKDLSHSLCRIAAQKPLAPDTAWAGRHQTVWSVPLSDGRTTWGVMQFAFAKPFEWLPRERELLAAAAERCWMAIEKARLVEGLAAREEQVRQLAEHMLHVEEAERKRISRELHDEAGQSMLCIRLQTEMVESALPAEFADFKQRLKAIRSTTEHTILEIRRLIAALSPAVLDQLGLGAALRQLVNRFRQVHNARVKLQLAGLAGLGKRTEVIVYRLVQECFHNIAKHSQAETVNLSVEVADGCLKLAVSDDGVGFAVEDAFAKRESFGLSGMRERVALLGGSFRIASFPRSSQASGRRAAARRNAATPLPRKGASERGTKIQIELPLPKSDSKTRTVKNGRVPALPIAAGL
jgi:signal transduction histidine kinase